MMTARGKDSEASISDMLLEVAVHKGRMLQTPLIPPKAAPRRFWLWAVLLGVGWHAVWWTWLEPAWTPRRMKRPRPVQIAYLAPEVGDLSPRERAGSLRNVWSPAYFALPSSVGFSRAVLEEELMVAPPLETPMERPRFLEPASSSLLPPVPRRKPLAERVVHESAHRLPSPSAAPVFRPGAKQTTDVVRISFSPALANRAPLELPLPSAPRLPQTQSWKSEATVQVDAFGFVEHVFLNTPAPSPGWAAMLSRLLHRLPLPGKREARRGVVWIEVLRSNGPQNEQQGSTDT